MKTLKDMLEGYQPVNSRDAKIVKKHIIKKTEDANKNGDDVFNAANIKKATEDEINHGFEPKEDESVYEALTTLKKPQSLGGKKSTIGSKTAGNTLKKPGVTSTVSSEKLGESNISKYRNHQFSNDIGGSSDNYREPKFGSGSPQASSLGGGGFNGGPMIKAVEAAGYGHRGSDTVKGSNYYAKSQNRNGDDHEFGLSFNTKDPTAKVQAFHKVSPGYWGRNYYNPPLHRDLASQEFDNHEDAIAYLENLAQKNKLIKEEVLKELAAMAILMASDPESFDLNTLKEIMEDLDGHN